MEILWSLGFTVASLMVMIVGLRWMNRRNTAGVEKE